MLHFHLIKNLAQIALDYDADSLEVERLTTGKLVLRLFMDEEQIYAGFF